MTVAGPCIAVVDDEASVRTALRRLLRLADYEVAVFGSGEEFLVSLTAWRADCAILDVHMPGLSGFDVRARLCAAHIDLPVVFVTASDDIALDRAAIDAGGALLRKPFSNTALLDAVGAALSRRPGNVS